MIASTTYECIMISKKSKSNKESGSRKSHIFVLSLESPSKWLIVFSLHSNILRVFKQTSNFERNINCLYAIRTLSILWLIVSDRFNFIYSSAIENTNAYQKWIKNGFSAFISSSDAAYDSIFIVSGFLLAIYCFRTFKA